MEVFRIWFFILIAFVSLVSFTVADELWSRYNTTLTPTYSGDDINLSGDLNVSGDVVIEGNLNTSIHCSKITGGTDLNFCIDSFGNETSTGSFNISYQNLMGSDLSGSDGEKNRKYISSFPEMVYIDNQILIPEDQYIQDGNNITFNIFVWDDQQITLYFFDPTITYYNLIGSDFSGSDGEKNRKYTPTSDPLYIIIDNQMLHPIINYNYVANEITLLNPLWDDQKIIIYTR